MSQFANREDLLEARVKYFEQQRDELLAALKEVTECLDAQITGKGGFAVEEVLHDALEAIAKCES